MGDVMQTDNSIPASEGDDEPLMTRDQLRLFLVEKGFPIGFSTLEKLCMPSRDQGPPVEAYWGLRPLYRPSTGLEWARNRLRPHRHRQAAQADHAI
jgi:hypothetical protein